MRKLLIALIVGGSMLFGLVSTAEARPWRGAWYGYRWHGRPYWRGYYRGVYRPYWRGYYRPYWAGYYWPGYYGYTTYYSPGFASYYYTYPVW